MSLTICYYKNNHGSSVVRCGQQILTGAYFQIPDNKRAKWMNNDDVLSDISGGLGIIAKDDSGKRPSGPLRVEDVLAKEAEEYRTSQPMKSFSMYVNRPQRKPQ